MAVFGGEIEFTSSKRVGCVCKDGASGLGGDRAGVLAPCQAGSEGEVEVMQSGFVAKPVTRASTRGMSDCQAGHGCWAV